MRNMQFQIYNWIYNYNYNHMARNGLLKRQLCLFDTAFVNRQCKSSPEGHQRLMKSSVALVFRLAASEEFCVNTLPGTTDSKLEA